MSNSTSSRLSPPLLKKGSRKGASSEPGVVTNFFPFKSAGVLIGESTGTRSARSPLRKKPAIETTGTPLLRAKAMVESAASPTSNCPAPTSCTVVTEPVPCWIVTSSPAFLNQPFSAARKNGAWYPDVSQSSRTERVCASSAASAACPANARANTAAKTIFDKFISVLPKLGFSHERGAAYKTSCMFIDTILRRVLWEDLGSARICAARVLVCRTRGILAG